MDGEHGKKSTAREKFELVGTAVAFVVALLFLVAFSPDIAAFAKNVFGGERVGLIEVTDCREIVEVKEGSFTTYINKFTCMDEFGSGEKTVCCRVEVEDGYCSTAHCYSRAATVEEFLDSEGY